ncbi:MAG: biosynthetic-type acetolactate synthase large subunit [Treponema sp.]|nr:biosynthetic-type acetolactate synthase large subunit [Treponema sp.]
MKFTGARILVEALIANGADTIFGYPGGAVLDIYDELFKCKDRIRHILVSHEQHAAHAADGYARSTGKTGICLATSGPGATNLVTGIATAFVDSVPLIAITGNVGIPLLGKDSFQEVDIAGITMPIVKHNWIAENVNELEEIVNEAFLIAKSGRPGPVLIDIPRDILGASLELGVSGHGLGTGGLRSERLLDRVKRKTFSDDDIDNAASLINESSRPMIYAGGGVINSGADAQLKKLAELLNAPVALSLMGMGAFPSDHNMCTGLIGMHGTTASNKAAQNADLVIAAGARFSDRVTDSVKKFAANAKIIHIDIDPAEINKNVTSDVSIAGDLKIVIQSLLKKLPSKNNAEWINRINTWKAETIKSHHRKNDLHPRFIINETAKALGEKAIVVTDVGQHQIWTAQFYPFKNPRSFLSSGGMGTMGYGMGAAAGAKLANLDSPVALFTGDGSFRMNCAEMATLVKYGLPILIIIFNNSTLGMLRQMQKSFYKEQYYETSLENNGPDFIKLAAAYNVQGFRAKDEKSFLDALCKSVEILASGKPALIEALIDRDERVVPMPPNGAAADKQIN